MKLKYLAVAWNEYAEIQALPETTFKYQDENTLLIDDEPFEFDSSVEFPDIHTLTNGYISEAHRDLTTNELYITARRFYAEGTDIRSWDTGDYHDANGLV